MTEKDYEHDMYYSKLEGVEEGMEKGMEKGIEKGMEKGIEMGKAEGEKSKALEIARSMISKGLSKDLIAEVAGLTEEEVKSL